MLDLYFPYPGTFEISKFFHVDGKFNDLNDPYFFLPFRAWPCIIGVLYIVCHYKDKKWVLKNLLFSYFCRVAENLLFLYRQFLKAS